MNSMNLNFSVNMLPPSDMPEVKFDEESEDLASIADKIDELEELEIQAQREEENNNAVGPSYKFMNPSCFFDSMRKGA